MVGSVASSSSSSRSSSAHGVDRFYHPPQMRHLEQQRQKQQQQQQQQQRPQRPPQQQRPARPRVRPSTAELRDAESRAESDDSPSRVSASFASSPSPSPPPRPPGNNLDRFLESTTPVVRVPHLAKKSQRARHPEAVSSSFFLEDLSDAFGEWSAYGAGVPLLINEMDEVVQYYVPYLSGIQLYARDPNGPPSRARRPGENSDVELYRDTSSESNADCGVDRRPNRLYEVGGRQQMIEQVNRLSLGDKGHGGMEVPYVEDSDIQKEPGLQVFEYLERDSPYARQPLSEKISSLVCKFPHLKTFKSSDLLPGSWLCVAWYPIYRIPTGPTLKDLDACFLTFHLLSAPFKNMRNGHVDLSSSIKKSSSPVDLSVGLPLPAFGLASYKFKGSIWNSNGLSEQQQAALLLQAADDWLKKIKVELPDFRFFMLHNNYAR